MISVVCAYNNEIILEDFLLKSLRQQVSGYELILLDTRGTFPSASAALNKGAKDAKGKYLMFVHQDVDLSSTHFLADAEAFLDNISDLGIAGVIGGRRNSVSGRYEVITNITHDFPPRPASTTGLKTIEKVETIDEVLFFIPRTLFNLLQFDEEVCFDWHLHAADYSLRVARIGLGAYVMPLSIHHKSDGVHYRGLMPLLHLGELPPSYYTTLAKLLKKHRHHATQISFSTGFWNTSTPLLIQRFQREIALIPYRLAIPVIIHYYELMLTGIRVISNEGWRSFWFKFRIWLGQQCVDK